MKISLQHCGKSFNRKWLFRNLNCTLQAGESWAFLGANGSGKSTLCLMLSGQVWPTEGTVDWEINGKILEKDKVFSIVSLASPAMELPEEFTLAEIIQMHGKAKPFLVSNPLEETLNLCHFHPKISQRPLANFSSGMKQRVKLCLAALSDTPLLLLDEPLTNLDDAGILFYNTLIEKYSKNRLTVIASNRQDEYQSCTRFLCIEADGSISLDEQLGAAGV